MNDFRERYHFLCNNVPILSAATGNHYLARLLPAPYGMEDDVLLQNSIIAESSFARLENMEPVNFQVAQEVLAEISKIRTIAKAPWRDSHKLPTGRKQTLNESDESCIKIARFNASVTQITPFM